MSMDRPGETEAQLVDRRMAEADDRARASNARIAARRAAGIPDEPCAIRGGLRIERFRDDDPFMERG